jgi:hypothetical protein
MLVDQIERQQRVTQVAEHPHEQHQIKGLAQSGDILHRELLQLDVHITDLSSKACLG